jgi:hypothetical protein
MNLQDAAKQLVERARSGDQIAMALITEAKRAAEAGSARAKAAIAALTAYVKAHPVVHGDAFGAEEQQKVQELKNKGPISAFPALLAIPKSGPTAVLGATAALANGGTLTSKRVDDIASLLDEPFDQTIFIYAVFNCSRDLRPLARELRAFQRQILQAGRCVGMARRIQMVRSGAAPVLALSPEASWELGEACPPSASRSKPATTPPQAKKGDCPCAHP